MDHGFLDWDELITFLRTLPSRHTYVTLSIIPSFRQIFICIRTPSSPLLTRLFPSRIKWDLKRGIAWVPCVIGTGEWTSKYLILFTTAIVSNSNVSGSRTQWRLKRLWRRPEFCLLWGAGVGVVLSSDHPAGNSTL